MRKWSEKNGIEFWTMSMDKVTEGLDVLRSGFFEDEAFCLAVGISNDRAGQRELEELAADSAKDEVSIMAVDKESKRVVGVSFNKYQTAVAPGQKNYFEEFRDTKCKNKSAVGLINKMLWFDSLVDIFGKYNADCSVEIMFLGTHRDFRKRGIAVGCVEASLSLARTLPSTKCLKKPPIVTAIMTSPYSIRIGRIHQFDELVHIPMQQKTCEGKQFSDNDKVGYAHPGAIVMVKRL